MLLGDLRNRRGNRQQERGNERNAPSGITSRRVQIRKHAQDGPYHERKQRRLPQAVEQHRNGDPCDGLEGGAEGVHLTMLLVLLYELFQAVQLLVAGPLLFYET